MTDFFAILEKYNFWNNNLPAPGLIRKMYIEKISGYIDNRLVKVLVGQRRSGKSYLLRQIIHKLIEKGFPAKNIFYLNKEITDFDFIENYKDLHELVNLYKQKFNLKGKIYLFIDEIQLIDGWEKVVNSWSQDYTQDYEIFISGSNSEMLSGELASLLSGRYIQFEVFPFSYAEFVEIRKLENSKKAFVEYLKTGGLPELFNLPDIETRRNYVQAVKDTVLLRDIVHRYNIKDSRLLDDIFMYLINNSSNLISINNIVNYLKSKNRKTHYDTVSNYIQYLRNAFLVHQSEKYNIKGKEILAGTHKYYTNDPAYKNYLYHGYAYGIGYMLENIIYLQLVNLGYKVYIGYLRNKEIDFVAIKGERKIYLQICYILENEDTIEREYSGLLSVKDNFEKFVVSLDDVQLPVREGIHHILAWQLDKVL
jgi:predicted AAA+ superfamily ATPase